MRHERKVVPKKSALVRFPRLPDPMCDIFCNKEKFYVDVMEDTHDEESVGV